MLCIKYKYAYKICIFYTCECVSDFRIPNHITANTYWPIDPSMNEGNNLIKTFSLINNFSFWT